MHTPTILSWDEQKAVRQAAADHPVKFPIRLDDTPFEGQIRFVPGYNELHVDTMQSHGQHGMEIEFALVGPLGAVSCALSTMWTPLGEVDRLEEGAYYPNIMHVGSRAPARGGEMAWPPTGKAVVVHWRTPMPDREVAGPDQCGYVGQCWSDLSYTAGDVVMVDFITFGHVKLFEHLKRWYDSVAQEGSS